VDQFRELKNYISSNNKKMMNNQRLLLLIFSFILFFLGFLFYDLLLNLFLPKFDCIVYTWSSLKSPIKVYTYFGLILSIIPLCLHYLWKMTNTSLIKQKVISILIVLFFLITTIIFSFFILKSNLELRCKLLKSNSLIVSVNIEEIRYWLYAFYGISIGMFSNYFYLKKFRS